MSINQKVKGHLERSTAVFRLKKLFWKRAFQRRLVAAVLALLPWIFLRNWLGIALCVFVLAWDLLAVRNAINAKWLAWLNAAIPSLEDSSQLLLAASTPIAHLQQQRLLTRIETSLTERDLIALAGKCLPDRHLIVIGSYILSGAMYFFPPTQFLSKPDEIKTSPAHENGMVRNLHLTISPPTYTRLKSFESAPKDVQVPEHSSVQWCEDAPKTKQDTSEIRLSNGVEIPLSLKKTNANSPSIEQHCAQWEATETVFWTWSVEGKSSRWTLKVVPDEAPQIKFTAPTELLQALPLESKSTPIAVTIQDDYQIVSASLHLTLARGSGENIRFSDREVLIAQTNDPKQRSFEKRWNLSELEMEAGDELYFFVRAVDNAAPKPHITTSPTYTIRLPAPEVQGQDVSVLPVLVKPESLRSQRQIIIDTEQLLSDMKSNVKMKEALIRARSEAIANDQGALRRRYGRFLGEESSLFGDQHDEHGDEIGAASKSVDLAAQYGHAHDQAESATLFDEPTKKILRGVLAAMWDAEKVLRAITPRHAIAPELKALEGIKQLQQADRIYLHKAAFNPPVIKEEKRLTGDVLNVNNVRARQIVLDSTVPKEIQELVEALGKDNGLPALWAKTARAWIASQIKNDEQRLAAQASVQDVLEGCQQCRHSLRAWLRQGIEPQVPMLKGKDTSHIAQPSAFEVKWRKSEEGIKP